MEFCDVVWSQIRCRWCCDVRNELYLFELMMLIRYERGCVVVVGDVAMIPLNESMKIVAERKNLPLGKDLLASLM